jgi:prepilin-type N-terminal cleavage/methylation domain-containing protein
MNGLRSRGFTLVELMVTLVIVGVLFAFSIPAFESVNASYQLKGATMNIAAQLRMAREKAIASGVNQTMHFTYNWAGCGGCDYHIHNSGVVGATFDLPRGITYHSVTVPQPTMLKDGRCNSSGYIILRNARGARDTISVQMSGLVLAN